MKYTFLSIFIIALSCNSPKKSVKNIENTKVETVIEESKKNIEIVKTPTNSEFIVVLKNPKSINDAKALVINSGLIWDRLAADKETLKIAVIKVPSEKEAFWLERLMKSGEFKSVNLNEIGTLENIIKEEESTFFNLRTTACFGDCPVFEMTIDANGNVLYNGIKHVYIKGKQEFKLTDEQFSKFKEKLNKTPFDSYKNKYDNPRIKDLSSTFITHSGKQIQIRLWNNIPDDLIDVHEYITGILVDKKFYE